MPQNYAPDVLVTTLEPRRYSNLDLEGYTIAFLDVDPAVAWQSDHAYHMFDAVQPGSLFAVAGWTKTRSGVTEPEWGDEAPIDNEIQWSVDSFISGQLPLAGWQAGFSYASDDYIVESGYLYVAVNTFTSGGSLPGGFATGDYRVDDDGPDDWVLQGHWKDEWAADTDYGMHVVHDSITHLVRDYVLSTDGTTTARWDSVPDSFDDFLKTSGGSEPTWPTNPGEYVEDNEIIWQCTEELVPFANITGIIAPPAPAKIELYSQAVGASIYLSASPDPGSTTMSGPISLGIGEFAVVIWDGTNMRTFREFGTA